MLKNYEEILGQIKDKLPKTSVYTMAFYPVNSVDMLPDCPFEQTVFIIEIMKRCQ